MAPFSALFDRLEHGEVALKGMAATCESDNKSSVRSGHAAALALARGFLAGLSRGNLNVNLAVDTRRNCLKIPITEIF